MQFRMDEREIERQKASIRAMAASQAKWNLGYFVVYIGVLKAIPLALSRLGL